jgi:deoxyribodipyrimidine photolyase
VGIWIGTLRMSRDLRLHGNRALTVTACQAGQAMPLFVLDPRPLASDNVGSEWTAF